MSAETYMVTSPLMGTFYRAPSPGEKSFVEVGQRVDRDEVVCVIESMKIFTEIRCEHGGLVKEILLENEEMALKNQTLVKIEKE